jgi:hypothetical protein
MTALILIAVVGSLGSLVLCRVQRTATLCDAETLEGPVVHVLHREHVAAEGLLAAMIARNHQGVLGDEQRRT